MNEIKTIKVFQNSYNPQQRIQNIHKHLRWRGMQQYLTARNRRQCCRTLHLRCLRESLDTPLVLIEQIILVPKLLF